MFQQIEDGVQRAYRISGPVDGPYRGASLRILTRGATAIAQDRLEPILRSRAVALGAGLRPSTEMTDFVQDHDGVTVTLQPRDGAPIE